MLTMASKILRKSQCRGACLLRPMAAEKFWAQQAGASTDLFIGQTLGAASRRPYCLIYG